MEDAAIAYALAVERMFINGTAFIQDNKAIIPIFVGMLFQSLEISIKHAGIESGLFTMQEARQRQNRSGHGIKELASLAVEKLGGTPFNPIVMALTFSIPGDQAAFVIRKMICGTEMENTRNVYASRKLGYAEVYDSDFAIIYPITDWILAVKQTALNLPRTIDILSQWRASESGTNHFAIWLEERR